MPTVRSPVPDSSSRGTRRRPKKASGLTCRNCRSKKIRCDGSQPSCGICRAYSEACIYDKAPPMSQILAMTERIADLERIVQELRQNEMADQPTAAPYSHSDAGNTSASQENVYQDHLQSDPTIMESSTLDSADAYYETTSSIRAPETVLRQQRAPETIIAGTSSSSAQDATSRLHNRLAVYNRRQMDFWEERVVDMGSMQLHLPQETVRRLLATHWTWVHPAFMFINRETFLRDAVTGGEFFSPLLLSALCLHSTRFADYHLEEELLAKTKLFLNQDMHKDASIPLVQALLILSAREIGRGNTSQSWLYSGMSFRMAIDLGLFSTTWQDAGDVTLGRSSRSTVSCQLAWSCFMWDKIISLYFGRSPMLSEPPKSKPSLDMTMDEWDVWRPNAGAGLNGQQYPDTSSYKISCWVNFCKLTVIINDVLFNIYGNRLTKNIVAFVRDTRRKLQAWRSQSLDAIRMDKSYHQRPCPPPHILTQNMLYYTTMILLHRPFRGNLSCRAACRESAEGVEHLLLLMERTFGLDKCTYAMAYCSYTAATVAVQDTKDGMPGAKDRLDTYARALQALRASCPGIQRSIDIIAECLASNPTTSPLSRNDAALDLGQGIGSLAPLQTPLEYLPAFPFGSEHTSFPLHDSITHGGTSPSLADSVSLPFLHLESYPRDWYRYTDDILGDLNFEFSEVDGAQAS